MFIANKCFTGFRVWFNGVYSVGHISKVALRRARLVLGWVTVGPHFLARDVIYTSRAYATMSVSVRLSVYL